MLPLFIMVYLHYSTADRKAVGSQSAIRREQKAISNRKKAWDFVMKCLRRRISLRLKGDIGVGHVRYSTAGESCIENAQPLVLNYVKGTLGLVHNGNLINAKQLRHELEYDGAIFQTTIDTEVIAYHIARQRVKTATVEEAVINAAKKLKGAYALVVMSPRKADGAS